VAVKQSREQAMKAVQERALDAAEERVLDVLVPPPRPAASGAFPFGLAPEPSPAAAAPSPAESAARQKFRKRLREGELDDREIEIELAATSSSPVLPLATGGAPGMEEIGQQLQSLFSQLPARRSARKIRIGEAMKLLAQEEAARLVNEEEVRTQAVASTEQNGIVFIDEIDKVASRGDTHGADVSRQGVQRDLLPLVEGTSVSTRYGMVRTDHILFICSGAFHLSRPSDLIPELQGRLPIRVELQSLSTADFVRILSETDASLVRQYQALLASESVTLDFSAEGIARIAEIAAEVNTRTENIGARRLHTVMERLLEEVSFDASSLTGQTVRIDRAYVDARLADAAASEDLARYIL
jgi:ATP-dependent HslUV protease ATP-binding subunit HslU